MAKTRAATSGVAGKRWNDQARRLAALGLAGGTLILGACGGSTEDASPPIQTSTSTTPNTSSTTPPSTDSTTSPSSTPTTQAQTTGTAARPDTKPCLPAAKPTVGTEYRVFNVASNDVLNIREFPGHKTAKVGALGPDTSGLRPTGNCEMVGTGAWWELDTGGAGAWVNSKFLTPSS